jgi:hypothetical protein
MAAKRARFRVRPGESPDVLKMPWRARSAVETGPVNDETAQPVCATCGRIPDDVSDARLTWAYGVEKGRPVWTCDLCSREHLRSIEGKLDSVWW